MDYLGLDKDQPNPSSRPKFCPEELSIAVELRLTDAQLPQSLTPKSSLPVLCDGQSE